MSNGLIKVTAAGKSFQLTFGMMAIEEIGSRQAIGSTGWFKLITDIIYGGYINEQYLQGNAPELSYREISEIVEDLITSKDKQLEQIFECFSQSKAGAMLQEAVKKKQEEEKRQHRASRKPTGTK